MSSNNFWIKLAQDLGFKKNDKIINLSKDPNKDKARNRVHVPVFPLNTQQQADILYLPPDQNGYKYLLVVADYKRQISAYPLKTITQDNVVEGFKQIYKNTPLKNPAIIQFDNGPEFKGKVVEYFKTNGSVVKNTKPYRSRQNGLVENVNFIIGKLVGVYQNEQLLNNKNNFKWVNIIPKIVRAYNESQKDKIPLEKIETYPKCKGDACNLLNVGDTVLIPLEHPIHPKTGELYPTKKFRSNDLRYEPKPYKIKNVVLNNNTPPLYMVDQKGPKVAYTKKQLIKIDNNELEEPSDDEEELPEGVYIIEKFLNKRKNKGKVQFLVKYKGYEEEKDQLWQDRIFLIKELGDEQFKELERDFKK